MKTMVRIAGLAVLTVVVAVACGGNRGGGGGGPVERDSVSAETWPDRTGRPWPLTVDSGWLTCDPDGDAAALWFEAPDGRLWPLTWVAEQAARRRGGPRQASIRWIRRLQAEADQAAARDEARSLEEAAAAEPDPQRKRELEQVASAARFRAELGGSLDPMTRVSLTTMIEAARELCGSE